MYVNYDLARAVLEDRRRRAIAKMNSRRRAPEPIVTTVTEVADVIELTFGTHCGTDQISA